MLTAGAHVFGALPNLTDAIEPSFLIDHIAKEHLLGDRLVSRLVDNIMQ